MGFSDDDDDDDELMEAPGNNAGDEAKKQQTSTKRPTNSTPALDMFGTDITKAAAEGKLDPVIGRDKEIERLAMILSRRKKNNPVLIGDPGVGKSAIVEGLALRIVKRQVSRILYDKRVISLDMTAALAGTKYRGQFEERIRSILSEVQKNPDIILFIDEIHNIVGAGGSAGSLDAANMMKPALARGTIQCIGATTPDEYRKSIEKDGALERRFQKVMVEPTTVDETIRILHNIKDKYEDHHNVTFTDDALEACVRLTERYISDRKFPDKAIDAMDEAGARAYITNVSVPKEIEQQEALIEEAKAKKNQAVKDQNFELAASFRDREKELSEALETMKSEWEKTAKNERKLIDAKDIEDIVSLISGVPVQRIAQTEGARLHEMKEYLQSKIVAQDEPISKLVKAILRSRAGIKDPNKPIGTFMFLGPTGVGKTHLAKELAKFMFGSTDALIRVDMSEYMEKFNVSRLVGAPPGYVGYEEGGQLTERVRRKPYSIVLLDEIEKAHPDVFNLLLQVMDEGRLTDSNGRIVDFKNTVIIMTSNVGTRQLKEFSHGIGFASQSSAGDQAYANSVIQKALHKSFSPEFLNRIDEILTFNQLSVEAIKSIIDIELKELLKRTEAIGIKLVVTDEAKEFIATKGYDAQYGARPLKRAIQTHLEDVLAEVLIDTQSSCIGHTVTASLDSDKQKIVMNVE
jgi:ATP-dependent Clp protease ATP-binding subunit ClpC